MRKAFAALAVLAAAVIGLSACGGSGGGTAASSPPTGGTGGAATAGTTITIKDFGYQVSGPISPGAKVTVKNDDDVAHTVTADTGKAFDVNVPASGSASFTAPGKAGTYPFHCSYHSNMHGKLVVT